MLRVLEIDTEVLNLTNGHGRGIVPEGAPPIDALVVCYDSSDSSSFEEVEVVLRKHCDSVYSRLSLIHRRIGGALESSHHRTSL